jgi:hypothetical protein
MQKLGNKLQLDTKEFKKYKDNYTLFLDRFKSFDEIVSLMALKLGYSDISVTKETAIINHNSFKILICDASIDTCTKEASIQGIKVAFFISSDEAILKIYIDENWVEFIINSRTINALIGKDILELIYTYNINELELLQEQNIADKLKNILDQLGIKPEFYAEFTIIYHSIKENLKDIIKDKSQANKQENQNSQDENQKENRKKIKQILNDILELEDEKIMKILPKQLSNSSSKDDTSKFKKSIKKILEKDDKSDLGLFVRFDSEISKISLKQILAMKFIPTSNHAQNSSENIFIRPLIVSQLDSYNISNQNNTEENTKYELPKSIKSMMKSTIKNNENATMILVGLKNILDKRDMKKIDLGKLELDKLELDNTKNSIKLNLFKNNLLQILKNIIKNIPKNLTIQFPSTIELKTELKALKEDIEKITTKDLVSLYKIGNVVFRHNITFKDIRDIKNISSLSKSDKINSIKSYQKIAVIDTKLEEPKSIDKSLEEVSKLSDITKNNHSNLKKNSILPLNRIFGNMKI